MHKKKVILFMTTMYTGGIENALFLLSDFIIIVKLKVIIIKIILEKNTYFFIIHPSYYFQDS